MKLKFKTAEKPVDANALWPDIQSIEITLEQNMDYVTVKLPGGGEITIHQESESVSVVTVVDGLSVTRSTTSIVDSRFP